MMRHLTLARPIAEQQWGRLVQQLTYTAEGAGGEVVRVRPQHPSRECHACGHRQKMPLGAREFACGGCGLVTDRDVNAARNILQHGIALAGWEIGSSNHPGASDDVVVSDVAGLPGQDVNRYSAEEFQHWILSPEQELLREHSHQGSGKVSGSCTMPALPRGPCMIGKRRNRIGKTRSELRDRWRPELAALGGDCGLR